MRDYYYKHSYIIKTETDNKVFFETCKTIENSIERLEKEKFIIDVDGSYLQVYYFGGERITVCNDFDIGAVYVNSNIDLERILWLKSIW